MSVKVNLDQLAGTLADYPFGYLITVGDDYQAHTVSIVPELRDGVSISGRSATAPAAISADIPTRQSCGRRPSPAATA